MKKIIALLQKLQIVAGGIFLTIFLLSVVTQIFARYLGIAVTWTEDVSLYAFIWAVFMGASAMVYERRHFAFTSLSDSIKSRSKKLLISLCISLAMLIFGVLMLYYGVRISRQFWNYRWVTIGAFKRGPVWLCLPIAGATIGLYTVYHIVNDVGLFCKGST
ncbi:MAG: TRAP transporter small permease subunit [Treponema sp.]|jgi:TRAP-type C4-dicarboxylate transport system permease small subunit|nr:TRAP transporter small permease subunit [Treponema sp.]